MLVPPLHPKPGGKRYVIGDIHGRLDKLKTLLHIVQPTRKDVIFFLGDYIDRGPDSKGVIDYINKLQDFCAVMPLRGNHEHMLLYAYYDLEYHEIWKTRYGAQTLNSFGVDSVRDIDSAYIKWCAALPIVTQSGNFVLCHAGVDFKQSNPFANTQENTHDTLFRFDAIPHPIGSVRMVIGHHHKNLMEIKRSAGTDLIHVDGGCGKNVWGNLIAFCLDDNSIQYS